MLRGVICGPTAVGKTAVAVKIARACGMEIISADSKQVYSGLEIGTAQPEISIQQKVPHHLTGFLPPYDKFSAPQFSSQVRALLHDNPSLDFILVGGSGLYIKNLLYPAIDSRREVPEKIQKDTREIIEALGPRHLWDKLQKVDPGRTTEIHPNDRYRIAKAWENYLVSGKPYETFRPSGNRDPELGEFPVIVLHLPREELHEAIAQRTEQMIQQGWLEEAKSLLKQYPDKNPSTLSAIGYDELAGVLNNSLELVEAKTRIKQKTRRLAKKQRAFFNSQLPGAIHMEKAEFSLVLEQNNWDWQSVCKHFKNKYPFP